MFQMPLSVLYTGNTVFSMNWYVNATRTHLQPIWDLGEYDPIDWDEQGETELETRWQGMWMLL